MTYVGALALLVAVAALALALAALRVARTALRAATAPPVPRAADDVDWQLQWIEPGVYFLANTSPGSAAHQVEVSSSLTPVAGGAGTTANVRTQRVNPGAWVEVRHPSISQHVFDDVERLRRSAAVVEELRGRAEALSTQDLARLAEADEEIYALHDRIEYTLSYSVSWRTGTGAPRIKTPLEQRLVPSPSGV